MDKGKLLQILRDEYGITNMKQLDKAIANQQRIDLTPFCGVSIKNKKAKETFVR